jgi:hypothetical protein
MFDKLAAKLVATIGVLALGVLAASAEPAGKYSVKGHSPGNDQGYTGQVVVTKTGDTYQVIWEIGGQIAVGTGIGSANFLVVTYLTGRQIGLALYARRADGSWEGRWTQLGGRVVDTENWTPMEASDQRDSH